MENPEQLTTPEQRKQISKILLKARFSLVGVAIKTSFGLFLSNLLVFLIKIFYLKDTDLEMQEGFVGLSVFVNIIFMIWYLHSRSTKVNEKVQEQVKQILKK